MKSKPEYNLKPCNECPFRVKSLPGYLGGFEAIETMRTALSESEFICHKTRETNKLRHCAGRFLFAANCFKEFRLPEYKKISEDIKNKNPERMLQILGLTTFISHHS